MREQIIYRISCCNTCWNTREQCCLFILQHLVYSDSTILFTCVIPQLWTSCGIFTRTWPIWLLYSVTLSWKIIWTMTILLYLFNSFATKHDRQNRKALKNSQESSSERTEGEKLTVPCHSQQRRESFLYKSDSEGEVSPRCMSPRHASFSEGYVWCYNTYIFLLNIDQKG